MIKVGSMTLFFFSRLVVSEATPLTWHDAGHKNHQKHIFRLVKFFIFQDSIQKKKKKKSAILDFLKQF